MDDQHRAEVQAALAFSASLTWRGFEERIGPASAKGMLNRRLLPSPVASPALRSKWRPD